MNKYHYLLILLITIYLVVMYESPLPVLLLLLELLFPVLQWLLILPVRRKLRIQFQAEESVYEVGNKLPVEMVIENPTIIPIANLQMNLVIENLLTAEQEKLTLSTMSPAKSSVRMPLAVSSRYCGKVRVQIEKIYIWDFLQLLAIRRKTDFQKTVLVIPSLEPVSMEISSYVKALLAECNEYDPHEKGNDPTEVFDVRDYRPGDRLQQVHWKLSAARDSLLVKELSKPLLYPAVILLAVHKAEPWKLQQMFSACVTLGWSLAQNECPCYLVFRDSAGNVQKLPLHTEENLLPCIETLFSGCSIENEEGILAEYEELYPAEQFARCLYITDRADAETAQQLYAFGKAQRKTAVCITDAVKAEREELFEEFAIELVQEPEEEPVVLQKHWII